MKKGIRFEIKKKTSALVLVLAAMFFSCGLDTFYSLEPPVTCNHIPLYSSISFSDKYFDFYTNDRANSGLPTDFKFVGTLVYYKIYKNYSKMVGNNSSVDSVNNSSNYNKAAELIINTYGYQQLRILDNATGKFDDFVVYYDSSNPTNKNVIIRLTDYHQHTESVTDEFSPHITVYDGSSIIREGIPRRNEKDTYTFDFGRHAISGFTETCPLPVAAANEKNDFEDGSFSDGYENIYFVDMYAVAYGRDVTFANYYSNVLHLGAVAIDSTSDMN